MTRELHQIRPILNEMGRAQAGTRFNIFRRFREAVLQRSDARQMLIDYWMGHASASISDRYGRAVGGGHRVPARPRPESWAGFLSFHRRYVGYMGYKLWRNRKKRK